MGQILALGGGLVLVAALFLPWFRHRELGPGIPNFVRNYYFWDFTLTMLGTILVLAGALVVAAKVFELPHLRVRDTTAKQLAFLLAAIGTVVILVKVLVGVDLDEEFQALVRDLEASGLTLADLGLDIGIGRAAGVYVGLAAGAIVTFGSLLAVKSPGFLSAPKPSAGNTGTNTA